MTLRQIESQNNRDPQRALQSGSGTSFPGMFLGFFRSSTGGASGVGSVKVNGFSTKRTYCAPCRKGIVKGIGVDSTRS